MVKFLLVFLFTFNALARTADDNLTREQAVKRKQQVKSVNYELYLELKKASDDYNGKTIIQIELKDTNEDLTIDANLRKIISIKVNGKILAKYPSRTGSFDIPKAVLAKKMNIEVVYSSTANNESRGFRKIKDGTDNEEYFFTDFEPYYAHWMFPCLDQPDLKATYKLTVKAPEQWKIIHNEMVSSESKEGDFKTTVFKKTPIFSTYSFFLGAGPFVEWQDKAGDIPLFLHVRKSIAKFADPETIFATIKSGLKFFTEYYDYPYPYSKYGQIFVPDLPMNAVESAGAVTFAETFIFITPPSPSRKEARDNVILHEIAHMWFGNLVTMKWWNDLWLKEGFATYSASLAQQRELKSDFIGIDFMNSKNWGLWLDLMATSHPIESDLPDVRSARGIFDGITYAKGASALKQLNFYVGEEAFQKGIRAYFKKYALSNADRSEFISSIGEAAGIDLKEWSQKWFQTSGANRIQFQAQCQKNKIIEAEITQEKSSSGTLSPHRTLFGFYKPGKESFTKVSTFDVKYETEKKIINELNGQECPQFVLPNMSDDDYGSFVLDKNSLSLAPQALSKLPEAIGRYQLWIILMQMVKDAHLAPMQFMQMAKEAFKFEKDENLLIALFTKTTNVRDFRQVYYQYLTVKQRASISLDLEKIFWQRMQTAPENSVLRNVFFDAYTAFSQSKEAQDRLTDIVHMKTKISGITIDPERRWRIYRSLSANGYPDALKFIENEMNFDKSMFARNLGGGAKASFPDFKIKEEIFQKLFSPSTMSYNEMFNAAQNFASPNYPEIMEKFVDPYFKQLTTLKWSSLDDFVKIAFFMFPVELCSKEVEQKSEKHFKEATNLSSISRKAWLENHDELKRCVRVRSAFK